MKASFARKDLENAKLALFFIQKDFVLKIIISY
jgi:hypothetical protein